MKFHFHDFCINSYGLSTVPSMVGGHKRGLGIGRALTPQRIANNKQDGTP